jgi:hypothetical protein
MTSLSDSLARADYRQLPTATGPLRFKVIRRYRLPEVSMSRNNVSLTVGDPTAAVISHAHPDAS